MCSAREVLMAALERAHAKTLDEYLSQHSDEALTEALEEFVISKTDQVPADSATEDAA